MSNIEEGRTENFIKAYEEIKAQSFIIESINKDFFFEFADCLIVRIKELEEHLKKYYNGELYTAKQLKQIEENQKKYFVNKQKVKDLSKEIQEEYNEVQKQFDYVWNKKSKDDYDRYKLQEFSAMQQQLGFFIGKLEELLEEK